MVESYTDYTNKITQAAAKIRDVATPDITPLTSAAAKLSSAGTTPTASSGTRKAPGQTAVSPYGDVASAAISNYEASVAATKQQADKAATGLEIMGDVTGTYTRNLEAVQEQARTKAESASTAFNAAAEKADEYVSAAKGRVTEVLNKIDEINEQIGKERDFAKAHAMQAAVQSSINTMKAEERNILETYGAGSKEYQQFQQGKATTLATVQSNIQANYATLAEEQSKVYLGIVEDAYTKSNMYLGYQEQQHVDMLKYQAQERAAYDLQLSQFEVGVEQLKMAGQENLANWLIESPVFSVDMTPTISLLAELYQTQEANILAEEQTAQAEGENKRVYYKRKGGTYTKASRK